MKTVQIDGLMFTGPYTLGKHDVPQVSGIALIITEAGEGFKIMSILHSDDIREAVETSPKQDCWKEHAYHGNVDIYVCETDMPPEKREEFRMKALEKRRDSLYCDELPAIEDDW